MEGFDYDAAAATVEIEDITRDATNREILRRLKENDPEFHMLRVVYAVRKPQKPSVLARRCSHLGMAGILRREKYTFEGAVFVRSNLQNCDRAFLQGVESQQINSENIIS